MLFAFVLATAIGGVTTAVWYWRLRQTGLAALIMLYASEGEQIEPARERYWSLDKRAKSVAVANMVCWVICVMGLGLLDQNEHLLPWVWQRLLVVGSSTVSMWATVIVAQNYNNRESTERWKRWKPRPPRKPR